MIIVNESYFYFFLTFYFLQHNFTPLSIFLEEDDIDEDVKSSKTFVTDKDTSNKKRKRNLDAASVASSVPSFNSKYQGLYFFLNYEIFIFIKIIIFIIKNSWRKRHTSTYKEI